MNLKEKIDKYKEQSAGKASPEMVTIMSSATAEVHASIESREIPTAGTAFPSFSLPDSTGQTVNSTEILEKGPLVLTFFRGVW